ncbi:hypothetical protein LCGC14_1459480 [marine sediment metagenome]|uniref:Uncharacterized protein n=1 Tax=marine sediment metagenome TaxID=412755 RepID=A0A0F9JG18_9ZZZZ
MLEFLEGYNWFGFAIAFGLLAILPVWIISLFEISFFLKVGMTIILGLIVFVAVKTGGTKRGIIFK